MLVQGIYELWGQGTTYDELRANVRTSSSLKWPLYETSTFSFRIERYRGVQAPAEHTRAIVESFQFLGFKGKVQIKNPDASLRIFEEYDLDARSPKYLYLGRWLADSGRDAKNTYDLKKRHYISTTSMDAELALLTANIALAGPGKLFYDPFMGTGGFPLACAHYGAVVTGSDIDGRSIRGLGGSARRGQTGPKNVAMNFDQYRTAAQYLGGFVSDLTHTPLRLPASSGPHPPTPYLDGIVCDPPYGIREGLKVLGPRSALLPAERLTHAAQYQHEGYIAPKRPYSFTALLDDILCFAAATLVPGGRLSMWMPTANDAAALDLIIPTHPALELSSVCVQPFNKWSRRLLTYRRRRRASEVTHDPVEKREYEQGTRASELNDFRRKYFQGFRELDDMKKEFVRMKVSAGAKARDAEAQADEMEAARVSTREKMEAAKAELRAVTQEAEAAAVQADQFNARFDVESRT